MQLRLYMRSVRYTLQMFANFGLKFAFVWKGFQIFAQRAFSQKLKKKKTVKTIKETLGNFREAGKPQTALIRNHLRLLNTVFHQITV